MARSLARCRFSLSLPVGSLRFVGSLLLVAVGLTACGRTALDDYTDVDLRDGAFDGAFDAGPDAPIGVDCIDDMDCDDGLFCNGGETCRAGRWSRWQSGPPARPRSPRGPPRTRFSRSR